jgi:hypothetical protein
VDSDGSGTIAGTILAVTQLDKRAKRVTLGVGGGRAGHRYRLAIRLKRLQRVGLLVLGIAGLGGGVAVSIMNASATGVVTLILPGSMLLTFAAVGVFPNVHLKDGRGSPTSSPSHDVTRVLGTHRC